MHEDENECSLAHDCVGKFGVSVTARKAIVEEKMYFIKSSEDFVFWKKFFESNEKIWENASDNCRGKCEAGCDILRSSGNNAHEKNDCNCGINGNIRFSETFLFSFFVLIEEIVVSVGNHVHKEMRSKSKRKTQEWISY